jgi:hypothetical protein
MASTPQPPPPSPIVAVCLVARDDTPLFFRHFAAASASAPAAAAAGADADASGEDEAEEEAEAAAAARLQLAVYASLDLLEERARPVSFPPASASASAPAPPQPASPGGAETRDPFLGLLMPVDDLKVFGYASGTQLRVLVVMRDVLLREDRVRELFSRLHRLYVDAVCAPFSPAGGAEAPAAALAGVLAGERFGAAVARLCEQVDVLYRGPVPG